MKTPNKVKKPVESTEDFKLRLRAIIATIDPAVPAFKPLVRKPTDRGYYPPARRCADHRNGGVTYCPRGGAALQEWQRQQWGD